VTRAGRAVVPKRGELNQLALVGERGAGDAVGGEAELLAEAGAGPTLGGLAVGDQEREAAGGLGVRGAGGASAAGSESSASSA